VIMRLSSWISGRRYVLLPGKKKWLHHDTSIPYRVIDLKLYSSFRSAKASHIYLAFCPLSAIPCASNHLLSVGDILPRAIFT
jgi:hypothetical protein